MNLRRNYTSKEREAMDYQIKELYQKREEVRAKLKQIDEHEYQLTKQICELEKAQKQVKLSESVDRLRIALREDNELYHCYQSSIACSVMDEVKAFSKLNGKIFLNDQDLHELANNAANRFLGLFIND